MKHIITVCAAVALLAACGTTPNTEQSTHFTTDDACTPTWQADTMPHTRPAAVRFFVESSGSMNGFFRAGCANDFKHDVASLVTNFDDIGSADVYTQSGASTQSMSISAFVQKMNAGDFASAASTDIPTMLRTALDSTQWRKGECAVIISDMRYDPVGSNAMAALLGQYDIDVRNAFNRPGLAAALIAARSQYVDRGGQVACDDSPYYYLVLGTGPQVVYMRNVIAPLLGRRYRGLGEWGVDYRQPTVRVPDADYLTAIAPYAYTDFDEQATITLDIDLTRAPYNYENVDTLLAHLDITTEQGAHVRVDKKQVEMRVRHDNDKELCRSVHALVPVAIFDMYTDSDVLSVRLNHASYQLPTPALWHYAQTDDVNDLSRTFSMTNFIHGCNVTFERFKGKSAAYILISTK